jgi:pimeloyl-ACP methyl ester carboxylesterase
VSVTQNDFRRNSVRCMTPSGYHRMAYLEWGDPANPRVLVCVHGLGRCNRDFDTLAQALAGDYRVVCPDVVGRGESDWLKNPMEYGIPTYVNDMVTLLARLNVESVDWVGTSMGGLIGMGLAGFPGAPIRKLVLNDVGTIVTAESLKRIATYFGKAPPLPSFEAAEMLIRAVSATFGPHSDAEWRTLTEHVVRQQPDGSWRLHYDPAIAIPVAATLSDADVDLWKLYEGITAQTLLLRGAESDLLRHDTALEMTQRGPKAKLVEFAGVGHAPTLMHEDQVGVVKEFLLNG